MLVSRVPELIAHLDLTAACRAKTAVFAFPIIKDEKGASRLHGKAAVVMIDEFDEFLHRKKTPP